MFRDITIGQYYPVESVIHRLDARVKLFAVMVFIITLFVSENIASYLFVTQFLLLCINISNVPFKYLIRGMKPLLVLLIFTSVLNMTMTPGDTIFEIWKITITKQGAMLAINVAVRLMYIIIASSMLTLTTTAMDITDALEKVLRPLNKIKIPIHEISMMMSIALRFIPILVDEADKIMKAQAARCMDFESRNIIKKFKNLLPLFLPLFVSVARRANELATAMESRCYRGSEGRTKMKVMKYTKCDIVAYGCVVLYMIVLFLF